MPKAVQRSSSRKRRLLKRSSVARFGTDLTTTQNRKHKSLRYIISFMTESERDKDLDRARERDSRIVV